MRLEPREIRRVVEVPFDVVHGLRTVERSYTGDVRRTVLVVDWLGRQGLHTAAAWVVQYPDRFLDALDVGWRECDRAHDRHRVLRR